MVTVTMNEEGHSDVESSEKSGVKRGRPPKAVTEGSVRGLRRLQITLSERAWRRLDELKAKTDASSATDVIRDALRLYDALVDEVNKGKTLVLESPDRPNEKEIIRLL